MDLQIIRPSLRTAHPRPPISGIQANPVAPMLHPSMHLLSYDSQ